VIKLYKGKGVYMDEFKLRYCAKRTSCDSCPHKRNCNYINVIQDIIRQRFIHIDLKAFRKHRQEGGKYKHK
jgi:hypothetical protein